MIRSGPSGGASIRNALAVLLVGCGVMAACSSEQGGSGQGGSGPVRTDAVASAPATDAASDSTSPIGGAGVCRLVTDAEAAEALGQEVNPGVDGMEGGTPVCMWTAQAAPSSPDLQSPIKLRIAVLPLTDPDRAALDELAADSVNQVIDGLGDLAVAKCTLKGAGRGCSSFSQLFVVDGEQYIAAELSSFAWPGDFASDDEVIAVLTSAATAALARL